MFISCFYSRLLQRVFIYWDLLKPTVSSKIPSLVLGTQSASAVPALLVDQHLNYNYVSSVCISR